MRYELFIYNDLTEKVRSTFVNAKNPDDARELGTLECEANERVTGYHEQAVMNFNDLLAYMVNYMHRHPSQRQGQAFFNALYDKHPDIANEIRGTDIDPFYDDGCLGEFLSAVSEKLS